MSLHRFQYLFRSKRESMVYMEVDSLFRVTQLGPSLEECIGTGLHCHRSCFLFWAGFSLAHHLSTVRQIDTSQSHAIFEYCLFSVHAQLFFPHRPQSSCICVQEPFWSIAGLYVELMVFSTNYIQLLPLPDFCYMNTKAAYSSWLSVVASLYAQVNSWYF